MTKYEMDLKLSANEMDSDGGIKAASLLHHFQEIASADVGTFGFGPGDLMKKNLIWVLTKLKYRIYQGLEPGETYTLMTCARPRRHRAITYKRDFYIYDRSGRTIIAAASQWCILNFETRKVEKTDLDFGDEFIMKNAFEEGIEKIHSTAPVLAGSHLVTEDDLDHNQHTNNSKYAEMIGEVTGNTCYEDFVIYFSKETRLGDEILLYREDSEEGTIVTGKLKGDDAVVFQGKVR